MNKCTAAPKIISFIIAYFIQPINECFSALLADVENVVLVIMSEKNKMQNRTECII